MLAALPSLHFNLRQLHFAPQRPLRQPRVARFYDSYLLSAGCRGVAGARHSAMPEPVDSLAIPIFL